MLNNIIKLFDTIVVGGAMANTFLLSNKVKIGASFFEKDLLNNAKKIQNQAINYNCKLILPVDVVCSQNLTSKINIRCCDINNISMKNAVKSNKISNLN